MHNYIIQVNLPEIEKQQYYVFGNYKRKRINELISKNQGKIIKQMEGKTIGEIFPTQTIRAQIRKKIRIGKFEPSYLDKQSGTINLSRIRMEMQKLRKMISSNGGRMEANLVRG